MVLKILLKRNPNYIIALKLIQNNSYLTKAPVLIYSLVPRQIYDLNQGPRRGRGWEAIPPHLLKNNENRIK